ncbi:MAG: 16S rRNA (adenine(1518)-N(6)/adenine(1519)-N(6))-dimethyltransferase RsmA [Thermoplasmataceae archaeon]
MTTRTRIPARKYGQVFLRDHSIAEFEVDQLLPKPGETVLEIGSGSGILTSLLVEKFSHVTGLEPDHVFYDALLSGFESQGLKNKLSMQKKSFLDLEAGYYDKIIGNIPYQISSQIVFHLRKFDFRRCILMVQKEFADRLIATPGTRDYSRISVNASLFYNIRELRFVPRNLFSPVPRVDSEIILIEKKTDPMNMDHEAFDRLLVKLFSNRRKMIRSILENFPDHLAKRRPDTLNVKEIMEIFNLVKK